MAVSPVTGSGMDEVRAALGRLLARMPAPAGPQAAARTRLWIDRSFTIGGAGTVVTGTFAEGALAVGDELDLTGRASGGCACAGCRAWAATTARCRLPTASPGSRSTCAAWPPTTSNAAGRC